MLEQTPSALPTLREELALHAAPAASDGSPAWTLHDPADNRFFQIGWAAFEILSRWPLGTVEAVVEAVNSQTTLHIETSDVLGLVDFVVRHDLVVVGSAQASAQLQQNALRHKLSTGKWLLKNYLFVRIPLVRPMPFLRAVYPWIRGVYSSGFWWLIAAVAALGLYLASRQWDSFLHTFQAYGSWQGLLGLGIALSVGKIVHELGHAFTAYRYGCRVPAMGVALLVMWPVLYTDTNEAWKLRSRRQRLHIGAAGILSELALAAVALLLWNFMPDGALRSGVFMLATSTWLVTVAINASPFMRFDGYFLLSDWLNLPNLHERSFAFGRWWLREQLFAYGDPEPESQPPARRAFLIAFAYATWLYRFFLFMGIALLVYHAFFRALGIVLLCVELGWFVLLPVARELRQWWQRRGELTWSSVTKRSLVLVSGLLLVLLLPWQSRVHAPALLSDAQVQEVHAPELARLLSLSVDDGERVMAGQVLARLESPDLDYRLARATAELEQLDWQVRQQPFDEELRAMGPALGKQRDAARQVQQGLAAQKANLVVRSPFAGRISDLNPALAGDAWIARGESLLRVVAASGVKGEAYIPEQEMARIQPGAVVAFVANLAEAGNARCQVQALDRVPVAILGEVAAASLHGGPIASIRDAHGVLVPLTPVFRMRFANCDRAPRLDTELAGQIVVSGERQSLLGRGVRWVMTVFHREAGL